MCRRMKRIKFLCALLLGVVWLLSPFSVAAENWPIKEFRVFKENPGALTEADVAYGYVLEGLGNAPENYGDSLKQKYDQQQADQKKYPKISDEVAGEIEGWLKRVAQEYEDMGFKAPLYAHIDSNEFYSKEAFKVYVYPDASPNAPYAAMLSPCALKGSGVVKKIPTFMVVNSLLSVKNGKLTTKAYQDMAHELFHAVQNSYDLFSGDCNAPPGAWITEGTAEIVGIEMARKLKGKQPYRCQMGVRRYSEELYVRERGALKDACGFRSYSTLSFWQFLGEYATRKVKIATEEFTPPDFRYLHNFFKSTHAMGSRSKEYAWLDEVLRQVKRYGKNQFGITLHTAYARFVGTFASYFRYERRKHYLDGKPLESSYTSNLQSNVNQEKNWIELLFGKCKEVSVTEHASSTLTLQIEPVAARCIKVNYDFEGRGGLTFYSTGKNQYMELDALVISTNGGEKMVEHDPAETDSDKLGKILIEANPKNPQYFIVSNVAEQAQDSAKIDFTLQIVPEIISTSMAKAKKKSQPKPDPTEKEELENAWASQSWKGHASQKEHSPCTTPFEFRACGPSTHIQLLLVSDIDRILDEVDEPTMSLERRMRVLDAFVKNDPEQIPANVSKAVRDIQQQDGWRIRMQIPQIQPGFVGSVENAHMTVARANNPDGSANPPYRAIGPGWVGPCGGSGLGYWPSSGQVLITEFSQHVLRGTFTARLVGDQYFEPCQPAPISRNISGSFTVTEIRWGDYPEPELSEEAILDDVIEDTNELLPGMISDEMAEYIKEQAKKNQLEEEKLAKEKAAKGKKTSEFQQCKCSCEMATNFCASNPTARCCVSCQPIFKLCNGNATSHTAVTTAEEHANEEKEVQLMRMQYEDYIESFAPNDDMKKQMMDAFDQLKTEEKKIMMMSIPK